MTAHAVLESKSPSRRALLAGALGGIGAWAASAVGRVSPVRGNNGDPVTVGNTFTGTNVTSISTTGTDAIDGTSDVGIGVRGASTSYVGVLGTSNSHNGVAGNSSSGYGVSGYNNGTNAGVVGFSASFGPLPSVKPKTGVYGFSAQDSGARGVIGETTSGHGVHGIATTGWAGYFDGRVFTNQYVQMKEISTPSAPGANSARLFLRDNGSGKTQLCVRFPTGAVQVIKTEP